MTNYDFRILQPIEFECLSRDLIQKRDNVYIESFTEGRDDGIDFRYAMSKDRTAVIQVKRYATYSKLLSSLKKEIVKVKALSPKRYYISTSVGLTPANKDEIQLLFGKDLLQTGDILGKDDLNNLLGLYQDIEKRYYKLWLSSSTVLESILHKRIENWAQFEMDNIKRDIHQYVENKSFSEALDILNEYKYVIISGIPGIGKTTLARMLVYQLLAQGADDFIYIPSDIDDAVEMFDDDRKQVFFFDDFLGSTVFEKGERKFDSKILSFIEKVQRSNGKRFILTTREYILQDAMLYYERFAQKKIDIAKCTLDLHHYTKLIKASILYNHLADADLPDLYIEELIKEKNYVKLIEHVNFNPRVVETFIKERIWEVVPVNLFMSNLLEFFDKPFNVWKCAFEKLEITARYALLTLVTMPTPIRIDSWREAFDNFCSVNLSRFGIYCDEQKWKETLKVLMNCFIKIDKLDGIMIVKFFNPSVKDFLSAFLSDNKETCNSLLKSLYFTEQIYTTFCDTQQHHFYFFSGSSYVVVSEDQYNAIIDKINSLHETKRVCRLRYERGWTNKIEDYDDIGYLNSIRKMFPIISRKHPGLIEQYVTQELMEDSKSLIGERMKLMKNLVWNKCKNVIPANLIYTIKEELESITDYISYIPLVKEHHQESIFDTQAFQERLTENIINEIKSIESEDDIDSLKKDIESISNMLPFWCGDFEDELEEQRDVILSREYEVDDDWSRYSGNDHFVREEDSMIEEMFTCLRVKER